MDAVLMVFAFTCGWLLNGLRWRYIAGKHIKTTQAFIDATKAETEAMRKEGIGLRDDIQVYSRDQVLSRLSHRARAEGL